MTLAPSENPINVTGLTKCVHSKQYYEQPIKQLDEINNNNFFSASISLRKSTIISITLKLNINLCPCNPFSKTSSASSIPALSDLPSQKIK